MCLYLIEKGKTLKPTFILKFLGIFLVISLGITSLAFGQSNQPEEKELKEMVEGEIQESNVSPEFKKADSMMLMKKDASKGADVAEITLPDDFYAEETCQDILSKEVKEKVSFNFENASIRSILKSLSEVSKTNLIVSADVGGMATLRVTEAPWNEALKILIRGYGLGAQCFNDIIRIATLKQLVKEARFPNGRIFREKRLKENSCNEIILGEKKRISFDFENGDIRNVLRFVAEIGNLNMVISPDVKGKVIMKLNEVPWNIALNALLTNYFLGQECVGNIIRIFTIDKFEFDNTLISLRNAKIRNSKLLAAQAKKFTDVDEKFGAEELDTLKPIPLELLKKIKEDDFSLYQDLEHYAGLFREKTELERMEMGAYISVVRFYKQLIDKGLEYEGSTPKTPLQVDYGQVRFVGTIMAGEAVIALVETSDNKGHTVKAGELVGPNFGIVKEILPDKIIVAERIRLYDGNIDSTFKDLTFIDLSVLDNQPAQNKVLLDDQPAENNALLEKR